MTAVPFLRRTFRQRTLMAVFVAGAVFGALPDLIGAYGFLLQDSGALYESAHTGPISRVLWWIPMSALHLLVDGVAHRPGTAGSPAHLRLWVEVLVWSVTAGAAAWCVRIRSRAMDPQGER